MSGWIGTSNLEAEGVCIKSNIFLDGVRSTRRHRESVSRFSKVDIGDCPVDAGGKGQGNGCHPSKITFLDRLYESIQVYLATSVDNLKTILVRFQVVTPAS